MISLFLDTSSSYLNTAIVKDGKVLNSLYLYLERDMSKNTLLKIKEMMDSLELKPNDISNIVVVSGPGSYTGLRVGITIAKTYAWGLNKKLYTVSSLQNMATCIKEDCYIVPLIDARRGYFFAGVYDNNYNSVLEDNYIEKEELFNFLNTLNKPYKFVSIEDINDIDTIKYNPDIENLFAKVSFNLVKPHELVPNYLKKTEAEENLEKC